MPLVFEGNGGGNQLSNHDRPAREPLASRSDREGLARAVVADIAPAVLRVADRAGSDPAQVGSTLRLTVEATAWSRRLGADTTAFPGMTLP